MMSKQQTTYRKSQIVIVILDTLLINLAFWVSYVVRYQLDFPYPVDPQYWAPFTPYIPYAGLLTILCLIMFRIDGLYERNRLPKPISQLYQIFNATTTSIVLIMALTFFTQPLVYSRGMLVLAGVLIFGFVGLVRILSFLILSIRRRRGHGVEPVIVVGAGEVGRAVMRTILADPLLGYKVVGYLDDDPSKVKGLGRIKSLGTLDELAKALDQTGAGEVIITLPWMYQRRIVQLIETCEFKEARLRIVPDVFQRSMQNIDLESLNGIPLISPGEALMSRSAMLAKRILDLVFSILVLPFAVFLFFVVGIAIKLDSRGPILFKQQRIGKNGQPIEVYKFRTMIVGAENMKNEVAHLNLFEGNTLLKIPDDPRVTRVGRVLRRASIDELPQLINVLRGEMSWVGPRPNTPDEVEQYEPWQQKRLSATPGITGLWQVSGRSDVPFAEMCLLDIFYIENWSLELDIRILLQTIPHVLFGDGAY